MFGYKTVWATGEYLKEKANDLQVELDVANETIDKQSARLKERDETIQVQSKRIVQLEANVACIKEGLFSIQNDLGMLVEKI